MADKAVSKNDAANAILDDLRNAATSIVALKELHHGPHEDVFNIKTQVVIDALRSVAQQIVKLGDTLDELEDKNDKQRDEMEELQEVLALSSDSDDMLTSWKESIEDFHRGLLDKDELLEQTVRLL